MKTTGKRKVLVFTGIWAALFAGTFVVQDSWGSPDTAGTADSVYADFVKQATRTSLDGVGRRSIGPIVALDEERTHLLVDGLEDHLSKLNNTLYDCLSETISSSTTRTNYFEISFVARERPSLPEPSRIGKHVTLAISDVVVERSTVHFTASEQSCVAHALQGLQVEADHTEPTRVAYVMCVTTRPTT